MKDEHEQKATEKTENQKRCVSLALCFLCYLLF